MSAIEQQDSHRPPSDGGMAKEEFIRDGTRMTGFCNKQNSEMEPAPARLIIKSAALYAAATSVICCVLLASCENPATVKIIRVMTREGIVVIIM